MRLGRMDLREIDGLVATRIMNLPGDIDPPEYTTDISKAWEVAEKFVLEWCDLIIKRHGYQKPTFHVFITDGRSRMGEGYSDNPALAICQAAIRASGIEHIE